jgi:D-amino-acid dehydrogenase
VHEPDVLVIGGGVAGLFCAYFLHRAGLRVTVVDRATVGGPGGCSYGNTGFVGVAGAPLAGPRAVRAGLRSVAQPSDRLALPLTWDRDRVRWVWHFRRAGREAEIARGRELMLAMKRRSVQILHDVCVGDGLRSTFTATGMVHAYKSAEGFGRACRSVPGAVRGGIVLRVLDRDELRALEPECVFDIAGALYNDSGGLLHAPEFVVEFGRTLAGLGVRVIPHSAVTGFEVSGATVARVRTTTGEFAPAEVVVAAGTWSTELARLLDVRLDLQPVKGYSITVKTPPNAPRGPVVLSEGTVAVRPLGERLRFAGDMALSGVDRSVSRRRVKRLLRTVHAYLPELDLSEPVEVWTGLRPCTPDSLPFLGRASAYDNVTIAAGHGHNGMGLAPIAGRLVAQIVEGSRPDLDVTPFRVDRYGSGPWWLR